MNQVKYDPEKKRFYMEVDGKRAELLCIFGEGYLDCYETYISRDLRGKGLASRLVKEAMEYAERNNLKIKPSCPFVEKYFLRHPEYRHLKY